MCQLVPDIYILCYSEHEYYFISCFVHSEFIFVPNITNLHFLRKNCFLFSIFLILSAFLARIYSLDLEIAVIICLLFSFRIHIFSLPASLQRAFVLLLRRFALLAATALVPSRMVFLPRSCPQTGPFSYLNRFRHRSGLIEPLEKW